MLHMQEVVLKHHNPDIGLPTSSKLPFFPRDSQAQWIPWCLNYSRTEISSFNFIAIHPLAPTVVALGPSRWDKGFLNSCTHVVTTQQVARVVPYHIT